MKNTLTSNLKKLINQIPIYFFCGLLSACESHDKNNQDISDDYYSGKNELCVSSSLKSAQFQLRKIHLIRDYYNAYDFEDYCRVFGLYSKNQSIRRLKKKYFTASTSICNEIMDSNDLDLKLEYTEGHICDWSPAPK